MRYLPAIIQFLGCDPRPEGKTWAEQLVRARTARGITQKEAARLMEVDPSTLARWEHGEREPTGAFAVRVTRFLTDGEGQTAKGSPATALAS